MGNNIKQYAIGEILDGRYFYIPAYQRGYRWTENKSGIYSEICSALLMIVKVMKIFIVYNQLLHVL